MSRALIVVRSDVDRRRASQWCLKSPVGTRIGFQATKRSIPQNDRLWAFLTEIADQVKWHGVKLSADDYKLIFLDALKRELRIVPNLDGTGFVNLGRSSSDLSKEEMGSSPDAKVPPRVRVRIFEANEGRCHRTDRKIMPGDAWELEHRIALCNGGQHRESNLAPILAGKPHKEKTAEDVAEKSKVYRMRAKHIGAWPKSRRPLRSRGFERRV
jgi:hypothetical protein